MKIRFFATTVNCFGNENNHPQKKVCSDGHVPKIFQKSTINFTTPQLTTDYCESFSSDLNSLYIYFFIDRTKTFTQLVKASPSTLMSTSGNELSSLQNTCTNITTP